MTRSRPLHDALLVARGEEIVFDRRHDAPLEIVGYADPSGRGRGNWSRPVHHYADELAPAYQAEPAHPESAWSFLAQIGVALLLTAALIAVAFWAVTR